MKTSFYFFETSNDFDQQYNVVFYEVNPHSPYSHEQATEYKEDRDLYELKVRYFTKNMLV